MATKEQELQYPLVRNENDSYIIFTPRVFNYAEEGFKRFVDALGTVTSEGGDKNIINLINTLATEGKNFLNANLNFTRDNFDSLLSDVIQGKNAKDPAIKLKISLPMKQISTSLSHKWKDEEVFQGSGVSGMIGATGSVLAKNLKSYVSRGLDRLGILGDIAGDVAGDVYQTVLSSSGQYMQKPTRAFYGGTDNTEIKLDYNFSPQSPKEALIIKKIVKMFQFLSTTQSGDDAYTRSIPLGKNPAIWKITFLNNDKKKDEYKTKKDGITDRLIYSSDSTKKNVLPYMVLKDVNVDFGGDENHWISFPDGFPPEISLSLQFSSYFSVQSAQVLFGYSSASDILNES